MLKVKVEEEPMSYFKTCSVIVINRLVWNWRDRQINERTENPKVDLLH